MSERKRQSRTPSQSEELAFAEPVQVHIRMQRSVVKVLRATAAYMDMPFSALIENMAVANFEGQCSFSDEILPKIAQFMQIYGLNDYLEALGEVADMAGKAEQADAGKRAELVSQFKALQERLGREPREPRSAQKKR